ncbi:MAG TPA: efflux transporter outer membrane subunit, partial [Burkholderiales bacterium]
TVGPDYKRPEMALPAQYPDTAAAKEVEVPPGWWALYRDPLLNELVGSAWERNADLRFAVARVQEAEALAREAGSLFYPEVTVGYGVTRNRVSELTSPPPATTAGLTRTQNTLIASTSYELDFWGRYARADEAARATLLGSVLSRDTVLLSLAGATAQSYFALRSADAQLKVLELVIESRREALELARTRANGGLASELDVYQAQATLSDALVQRYETERNRQLVERQLAQLTGRLDLKVVPGDLFTLPVPPPLPPGLPSTLLERRPDVRAAEQNMVSANAQIGIARAAQFPTISLTAAVGSQSAEFSDLLSKGAGIWSLGLNIAGPLFDAGRREARVDQARARSEQAVASYQRSVETAFREVADALVNVDRSNGSEAELELRLKAARAALDLSNERYRSGYSPFLEVLDAQRTVNDAAIAFVRNRQARLAFSVDLMKALGGGWSDGVEPQGKTSTR